MTRTFKWTGPEKRYLAGANREPGEVFEARDGAEMAELESIPGVERVETTPAAAVQPEDETSPSE